MTGSTSEVVSELVDIDSELVAASEEVDRTLLRWFRSLPLRERRALQVETGSLTPLT